MVWFWITLRLRPSFPQTSVFKYPLSNTLRRQQRPQITLKAWGGGRKILDLVSTKTGGYIISTWFLEGEGSKLHENTFERECVDQGWSSIKKQLWGTEQASSRGASCQRVLLDWNPNLVRGLPHYLVLRTRNTISWKSWRAVCLFLLLLPPIHNSVSLSAAKISFIVNSLVTANKSRPLLTFSTRPHPHETSTSLAQ
jgi:hypothetical protein